MTEPDDPQSPNTARSWSKRLALLLLSLAVAGVSLWILQAGALPVIPAREAWSHVNATIVGAYVALWGAVLLIRTYRWIWLLAPHGEVSSTKVTLVGLVGLGALLVFPMRLGEFVRPVLLRRYESVSTWTAIGTVGAERIIDGFVLSLALLTAMAFAPAQRHSHRIGDVEVSVTAIAGTMQVVFVAFAALMVGLIVAYWQRELANRVLHRVLSPLSAKMADAAAEVLDRLLAGLAFLPYRRDFFAFVVATVLYWGLNGFGMWMLARGCDLPLTLAQAWVVLGLLALGILVPNAPGYFGVFQLSAFIGLSLYVGPDRLGESGAAFVVVLYSVQLGGTLLAAFAAWLGLRALGESSGPEITSVSDAS